MESQHNYTVRLSEAQKHKLRTAYKRRKPTVIRLSNEQLSHGSDRILLSGEQHKAVSRAVKNKKGLQLLLSYNQLVFNKLGGFLKEIMEMVDSSVPGGKRFISPLIRRKLAPLLREKFIPWLKSLVDEELDTIIEKDPTGRGLKRRIGRKLDALLSLLPDKPTNIERGIVNLGDLSSGGTHWTCYVKRGEKKFYFDSYGDVNPPIEVVSTWGQKGWFITQSVFRGLTILLSVDICAWRFGDEIEIGSIPTQPNSDPSPDEINELASDVSKVSQDLSEVKKLLESHLVKSEKIINAIEIVPTSTVNGEKIWGSFLLKNHQRIGQVSKAVEPYDVVVKVQLSELEGKIYIMQEKFNNEIKNIWKEVLKTSMMVVTSSKNCIEL
ncbi:hypothetical protein J6590_060936 [Homalodisca vitripennis]|nr:hypothetical protein J6590_060936 [Homalodisca vitripennis]